MNRQSSTSFEQALRSYKDDPDLQAFFQMERIGPYRVLDLLGEGGMAVVFLAQQEEPVRRRVALKVLKLGMDTREVLARFEAERQALALMSHPNIASVYDGGVTERGRSYFVLEFVPGEPITAYCDRRRLSIADRLDLFQQVCRGVQHAHQKGIIHRDLKPSNVLVCEHDGRPLPKIIDFGVAKATNQRLAGRTLHTQIGQIVGTPGYISPEQAAASNLDIDTRTDIYSLGVLLYELLVGILPFGSSAIRAPDLDAAEREILHGVSRRPSSRLSSLGIEAREIAAARSAEPRELRRLLRGDLDWIAMKTLEKDRCRRYATAAELEAEIRRHLDHRPVLAGAPGIVYRARKFMRRNRVATGVALALPLVLGAILWQYIETLRTRDVLVQITTRLEAEKLLDEAETILWPLDPGMVARANQWIEKAEKSEETLGIYSPPELESFQQKNEVTLLGSGRVNRDHLDAAIQDVKHRIAWVHQIRSWTLESASAVRAWRVANLYLRTFYGFELKPRFGLLPLGVNRGGCYEFWYPLPDSGEPPSKAEIGLETGLFLVLVPGGSFWMGAVSEADPHHPEWSVDPAAHEQEGPPQRVRLDPFLISKYELTQEQWTRFARPWYREQKHRGNPSYFNATNEIALANCDRLPVEQVDGASIARGMLTKMRLDLPTEARWEYAARQGGKKEISDWTKGANLSSHEHWDIFGGHLDDASKKYRDGFAAVAPVDECPANALGIHGMAGNVSEWCRDEFVRRLDVGTIQAGNGLRCNVTKSSSDAIRGPSFRTSPVDARITFRCQEENKGSHAGMRPVLELGENDLVRDRPQPRWTPWIWSLILRFGGGFQKRFDRAPQR